MFSTGLCKMSVSYTTFETDIKTRLSNGSTVEDVLNYYKHFDQTKIQKIVNKVNKVKAPKKEKTPEDKQPPMVKMIKPNDERVKNMRLGSYAHVLGGVKNKAFWMCLKCERIYTQREEAKECFMMIGSTRTIQSNAKAEIGTITTVTIKKQNYKGEIIDREVNDSYQSTMGMHDPRYNWYYDKQRQYIYTFKILSEA